MIALHVTYYPSPQGLYSRNPKIIMVESVSMYIKHLVIDFA